MNADLIRIIDGICRDKRIEREFFIADLEQAIAGAVRKQSREEDAVDVRYDPLSGEFRVRVNDEVRTLDSFGRIAAQTAKQFIIQKTKERERASIYEDFTDRVGTIVTGTVSRQEGPNLLVNLGSTEGFLPRSEQIPGETHQVGERIRVLILEVREQPNQIKIILSRSHPKFIEQLFSLEVPEVAERTIELKALAREAGYRTKVAVSSIDSKVDAVGACVGVRGSRIKNIVEEINNEKIDIVRWNESSQILIQNALKPAEVQEIALCFELGKATVVVAEDQLSLAIGKRGQNVRLAARLTGWDVDILTPAEYTKHLENLSTVLKRIEGVDDVIIDKLIAIGCVTAADIDEIGPDPLVKDLGLEQALADKIADAAAEEAMRQEEEREAQMKANQIVNPAPAAAPAADAGGPSGFVPAPDSEVFDDATGATPSAKISDAAAGAAPTDASESADSPDAYSDAALPVSESAAPAETGAASHFAAEPEEELAVPPKEA